MDLWHIDHLQHDARDLPGAGAAARRGHLQRRGDGLGGSRQNHNQHQRQRRRDLPRPNPLPDDDQPLETGTWATYSWSFDGALLRRGRNEISISNLETGAFSLPPFFMLDYAELIYGER